MAALRFAGQCPTHPATLTIRRREHKLRRAFCRQITSKKCDSHGYVAAMFGLR
jgi:hypothetical protein